MTDTVDRATRSRMMASIRSVSRLELRAKAAAEARAGCRLRHTEPRALPGSPDWANRRCRVAVFVDGCFFHGCPRHYREPGTNRRFWRDKVAANRRRDRRDRARLRRAGWTVIRLWEHEIVKPRRAQC